MVEKGIEHKSISCFDDIAMTQLAQNYMSHAH